MAVNQIVVLDLCVIIQINKDTVPSYRKENLECLRDSSESKVSLLLAIIEMATDDKNFSVDDVTNMLVKDRLGLVKYFGEKKVFETEAMLKKMIQILMDPAFNINERAELTLGASRLLLDYFDSHRDRIEQDRHTYATDLVKKANELGLPNYHPTIMMCLATLYGCDDAKNIVKDKKFRASNALGDIMVPSRIEHLKFLLKQIPMPIEIDYLTHDNALGNILKYIYIDQDADETFRYSADYEKLFPDLYVDNIDEGISKLRKLLKLN